jgi:hypothetical protein
MIALEFLALTSCGRRRRRSGVTKNRWIIGSLCPRYHIGATRGQLRGTIMDTMGVLTKEWATRGQLRGAIMNIMGALTKEWATRGQLTGAIMESTMWALTKE